MGPSRGLVLPFLLLLPALSSASTTPSIDSVEGCRNGPGVAVSGCENSTLITFIGVGFNPNKNRNAVTFLQGQGGVPKCLVTSATTTKLICRLSVPPTTRSVWAPSVQANGKEFKTSVSMQFDPLKTDSGRVQVFGLMGCRVNGVAATGCATNTIVTILGSHFDPKDTRNNVVTFVGGDGVAPSCAPTLRVDPGGTTLQCVLVMSGDSHDVWRVLVTVSSVTSLSTVTLDADRIVGSDTDQPDVTPVDQSSRPAPPQNEGNIEPISAADITGISREKHQADTAIIVVVSILVFGLIAIGTTLVYKCIIVPWGVEREAARKRFGPTIPPDMSRADQTIATQVEGSPFGQGPSFSPVFTALPTETLYAGSPHDSDVVSPKDLELQV